MAILNDIILWFLCDVGVLMILLLSPLLIAIIIAILPRKDALLKDIAYGSMFFIFLIVILIINFFDCSTTSFQFMKNYSLFPSYNIWFNVGVDGISLSLIFLTVSIMPVCLLSSYNVIKDYVKEYIICLFLIEFLLLGSFMILDALLFYVFFESVLIPMFLVIVIYGSRERKSYAAFSLFLYTLFGSLFMLITLFDILSNYGSLNYFILLNNNFSESHQHKIFLGFLIA